MDTMWQDLVNSDWHDYRGTGQDEDRLLRPGWIEQLLAQWKIQNVAQPREETVVALQQLRALLQHIIQALLEERQPMESDIATLNGYFERAPSHLHLAGEPLRYVLEQVPYRKDWDWVLSRIAASFAMLLAEGDPTRIKQCENPACRWIYYDQSGNKSRRWCEETCANIMRVRRFRERHRPM